MDNSLVKQLYDFLLENQLITPNISEEESLELLQNTIDTLDDNENILTGFIVDDDDHESTAYVITDESKLRNNRGEVIDTGNINNIENTSTSDVTIITPDEELTLIGATPNRTNAISDALYTALSEILPEDRVNDIFAIEPESEEDEVDEGEVVETDALDVPELSNNEIAAKPNYVEPIPTTSEPESHEIDNSASPILVANSAVEEPSIIEKKKPKTNKKTLMYVLGAAFVIIIAIVGYFVVNSLTQNSQANAQAEELVGYLNQVDNVYYQAEDYVNAGIGGSTPDNWSQLNDQAVAIQEELYNFEPSEKIDELYQSVYFYNDALITALYYGQNAATSGNPGQLEICRQRLEDAYKNRLGALVFLDENYPDLYENLEHPTDLKDEDLGYNDPALDELINEANSKPSNEAGQNTKSSNEARENSIQSD